MKKLLIFAIILLVGCATYPKAEFKDGHYVNYEYDLVLEMPEGWEYSETPPPDMRSDNVTANAFLYIYKTNKDMNMSSSVIILSCYKESFRYDYFFTDEGRKAIENTLENTKTKREFLGEASYQLFEIPKGKRPDFYKVNESDYSVKKVRFKNVSFIYPDRKDKNTTNHIDFTLGTVPLWFPGKESVIFNQHVEVLMKMIESRQRV